MHCLWTKACDKEEMEEIADGVENLQRNLTYLLSNALSTDQFYLPLQ